MKQETEAALFNSVSPPDTTYSHQTSNASSPERLDSQRRHSVEFVHSPSHPMGSKPAPRKLAEDEAFWLGVSTPEFTSFSQPITTSFSFKETEISHMSSTQQPSRLILGSSQPKRKNKQLFGRNPFQRATQDVFDDTPVLPSSQTQSTQEIMTDDDDDDDMEGIEIINHEVNPFRNYDPSLFHWEDPSFSVGPGFFSKASSCYLVPMLNEPTRRDRVLRKLEKGTLGEVLQENQNMEEELDDDMRQFISKYSRLDPNVSFFLCHKSILIY